MAKELGIYDSSLGNWVRQARERAEGEPTVEERAEIRELKRELERVTREPGHLGKSNGLLLGTRPEERVMKIYLFIAEGAGQPQHLDHLGDVPCPGSVTVRVLRLARPWPIRT